MAPIALAFAVLDLTGLEARTSASSSPPGRFRRSVFILVGGSWADRLPRHA